MAEIWSTEYLTRKPEEFQKLNNHTYVQRRNFTKEIVMDQEVWKCESRFISKEVYESYVNMTNSPFALLVQDDLSKVKENQVKEEENSMTIMSGIADTFENLMNADENTLIIMQAIADLYETIAVLSDLHKEG